MRTRLHPAARLLLALAVALPAAAGAQVTDSVAALDSIPTGPRSFEVSALTGYQWFDKSAALRGTPTLGLRIVRPRVLAAFPGLSVGANAAVARPTTRGDYFPWNRQIYYSGDATRRNDTTLVYEVSQRVSMAWFGLDVGYRTGGLPNEAAMRSPTDWRALVFDASVGAGLYGFWLDPEQARKNEMHSFRGWLLGGGVGIPLPGNTKILLRAEDLVFIRYDRNWFSLHDPLFAEELFPNPVKTPPEQKFTVHNPRITVQFSFFPGGTVTP